MTAWGYGQNNGPATWAKHFQHAGGNLQSPIDIKDAVFDPELSSRPFAFSYGSSKCTKVLNNGFSFMVEIDQGGDSSLSGGPLKEVFKPVQFHFHWGKEDDRGSEHTVAGKKYAAELHIVHWNTHAHDGFPNAASCSGGLAVLGMFVNVGSEHQELQKALRYCDEIKHAGDSKKLGDNDNVNLAALLPKDTSKYWTYSGSLTTPPCYESVNWIVFQEPIEMSKGQMDALRELRSHKAGTCPCEGDEFGGLVIDNYRPPQPLGERVLRASFQ